MDSPTEEVVSWGPVDVKEDTVAEDVPEDVTESAPLEYSRDVLQYIEQNEATTNEPWLQATLALGRVQSAIGGVKKTGKNTFFNNARYIELSTLLDALHPEMEKNGLVLLQNLDTTNEGQLVLSTRLVHESGGFLGPFNCLLHSKDDRDPQKVGSVVTYYRRYALMTLFAIGGEDDDGGRASSAPKAKKPVANWTVSSERTELSKKLKASGVDSKEKFAKLAQSKYNVSAMAELTDAQVTEWLNEGQETGAPF
jgi:hypothetical protein